MNQLQIRKHIEEGNLYKVTPEDLELYQENMRARENLDIDGVKALYNAICERAVLDNLTAKQNKAVDHLPPRIVLRDTNAFFDSKFFRNISGVRNGNIVREEIQKRHEEIMEEEEIKKFAKAHKVELIDISRYFGSNEEYFFRKLRSEFGSDMKDRVLEAITLIAERKKGGKKHG